jgi:transmembrane sensor
MTWKTMPIASGPGPLPDDVDEAAARWSEILRDAGPDTDASLRAAFESWRSRSQAHAAAFRRVEAAHALAHALADAPEMLELRRETLARASTTRPSCAPRTYGYAIAASLAAFAAVGLLILRPDAPGRIYRDVQDAIAGNVHETGIGQRSVVKLDDGSVITLNTDSRVSVHYEGGTRAVTLERGQALFKVAKDRARPFVVTADGRQVTALGTEFEVHMSERLFEVTLLEGRVSVTRERTQPTRIAVAPTAELQPGQQFVALEAAVPQVRAADVKREVSWRHGQVVFENESLADAVAEINRYSRNRIVLGDSHLASLKISGAFNTGDTDTFVDAVTAYFPIERAASQGDAIVLTPRAPERG